MMIVEIVFNKNRFNLLSSNNDETLNLFNLVSVRLFDSYNKNVIEVASFHLSGYSIEDCKTY